MERTGPFLPPFRRSPIHGVSCFTYFFFVFLFLVFILFNMLFLRKGCLIPFVSNRIERFCQLAVFARRRPHHFGSALGSWNRSTIGVVVRTWIIVLTIGVVRTMIIAANITVIRIEVRGGSSGGTALGVTNLALRFIRDDSVRLRSVAG